MSIPGLRDVGEVAGVAGMLPIPSGDVDENGNVSPLSGDVPGVTDISDMDELLDVVEIKHADTVQVFWFLEALSQARVRKSVHRFVDNSGFPSWNLFQSLTSLAF